MSTDVELNAVGLLRRREIEARILAPILDALGKAFGREAVLEITRQAIVEIARRQGAELAGQLGSASLDTFGEAVEQWSRGGALELRIINQSAAHLDFDVMRCKYAEMYRELGLEELGAVLSCSRDAAFGEGYNSQIHLERTQTILQGARHCDFRYSLGDKPA